MTGAEHPVATSRRNPRMHSRVAGREQMQEDLEQNVLGVTAGMTMLQRTKPQSYFEAQDAKKLAAKRLSPFRRACHWVIDNQIEISLSLLGVMHGYDYFVTKGTSPFVHLQHKIPGDVQGRYYRGKLDVYFIAYWVVMFTLVRALVMYRVLEPFIRWYGVRSQHKITRFGEQGWLTIYYIISNAAGVYVMSQGPHWMNTREFWADYPEGHRQMSALMKSYYLVQMGFWFQQIFVLLIEERRKDFVVMGIHHVVTCNLLGWSLYMNYTRVGNAVLCCMDSSDIFLSGTKCIRYLGFENLTRASFVVFILSWVYTRHYLYMKILISVFFESHQVLGFDRWNPEDGAFYNRPIIGAFTVLLSLLQLLIIYWFMLVLRIVYRAIFFQDLDDSRSDSEDNGDDDINKENAGASKQSGAKAAGKKKGKMAASASAAGKKDD
ncbi:Sphingosine N-acyltransferase lag1 [Coemansia sp. Benny D115]|nr:Sphingosine N-acyltransferase lag1 [Coemansia sp. Benny D115]